MRASKNRSQVKIWENIDYSMPKRKDAVKTKGGKFKKEGPFKDLTKTEAKVLSKKVITAVSFQVNWNRPDRIEYVKPKHMPEVKIVKF